MSDSPGFFTNVICFPYTFPIGLINEYIMEMGFCYKQTIKKVNYDKLSHKQFQNINFDTTQNKDHLKNDMKTGVKYQNLVKNVRNIISKNKIDSQQTQSIEQNLDLISPDFMGLENYYGGNISQEEVTKRINEISMDDRKKYKKKIENQKRQFIDKGNILYVQTYGCERDTSQTATLKSETISKIDTKNKNEIINHIKTHVTDNLQEMGANQVSMKGSAVAMDNISSTLIDNVQTHVDQKIRQLVEIKSNITYYDRYAYCDIERLKTSDNYGKIKSPPSLIQNDTIELISKNIIDKTIETIMHNDNMVFPF